MQLKIEKGTFTNHSLEDVADALKKGLSKNFKNVEVEVVDCPNLREWDCPSEGISGNQKIIDFSTGITNVYDIINSYRIASSKPIQSL